MLFKFHMNILLKAVHDSIVIMADHLLEVFFSLDVHIASIF